MLISVAKGVMPIAEDNVEKLLTGFRKDADSRILLNIRKRSYENLIYYLLRVLMFYYVT